LTEIALRASARDDATADSPKIGLKWRLLTVAAGCGRTVDGSSCYSAGLPRK